MDDEPHGWRVPTFSGIGEAATVFGLPDGQLVLCFLPAGICMIALLVSGASVWFVFGCPLALFGAIYKILRLLAKMDRYWMQHLIAQHWPVDIWHGK